MDALLDELPAAATRAHALDRLPQGTVLLHAGQHKTGSTALQNALAACPQVLHAAGWCYPEPGRIRDADTGHRHRHLVMEMLGPGEPQHWPRLRAAIASRKDRVLLSHEGFFCPAIDPQRVARQLPGHELHVLVYLRHPVDYIDSSYREWARRWRFGGTVVEWYLQRRSWLDVETLLARWEAAFGAGRVHLRAYARERLHGGSVVSDLSHCLGLPPLPGGDAPANASLNTRQCLVHAVANRVGADAGQRDALSELLADAQAADELGRSLDAPGAGCDLSDAHRAALARVLQGVAASARLVDDELAAHIEQHHLPAYQRVLAAQGQSMPGWQGAWRRQALDASYADAALRQDLRALLGH